MPHALAHTKAKDLPLFGWDDLLLKYSGQSASPRGVITNAKSAPDLGIPDFAIDLPVDTLEGTDSSDLFIPRGAILYVSSIIEGEPQPGAISLVQVDAATMLIGVYDTNDHGRPRLTLPNQAYPTIDLSSCEHVVFRGEVVGWRHP